MTTSAYNEAVLHKMFCCLQHYR